MKIQLIIICICVLGVCANAQNSNDIRGLGWIAGCWESNDTAKRRTTAEHWMKPAGGLMLGVGRTVKNDRAVDFEFMRIEQKNENIFFIAKPKSNKDETPFKLIKLSAFEAVFENPDHDFPQRVIYKRAGKKLTGRIEGNKDGKVLAIDFPMTKTRCD